MADRCGALAHGPIGEGRRMGWLVCIEPPHPGDNHRWIVSYYDDEAHVTRSEKHGQSPTEQIAALTAERDALRANNERLRIEMDSISISLQHNHEAESAEADILDKLTVSKHPRTWELTCPACRIDAALAAQPKPEAK